MKNLTIAIHQKNIKVENLKSNLKKLNAFKDEIEIVLLCEKFSKNDLIEIKKIVRENLADKYMTIEDNFVYDLLKTASGNYIQIISSEDKIDTNNLEKFIFYLKDLTKNSDFIINSFNENNQIIFESHKNLFTKNTILNRKLTLKKFFSLEKNFKITDSVFVASAFATSNRVSYVWFPFVDSKKYLEFGKIESIEDEIRILEKLYNDKTNNLCNNIKVKNTFKNYIRELQSKNLRKNLTLLLTMYKPSDFELKYWVNFYKMFNKYIDIHFLIDGTKVNLLEIDEKHIYRSKINVGKFSLIYNHIKSGEVKTPFFKVVDPDDFISMNALLRFDFPEDKNSLIKFNSTRIEGFQELTQSEVENKIYHLSKRKINWGNYGNSYTMLPTKMIKKDKYHSKIRIDSEDDQMLGYLAYINGAKIFESDQSFYLYISNNGITSDQNIEEYVVKAEKALKEIERINSISQKGFGSSFLAIQKHFRHKLEKNRKNIKNIRKVEKLVESIESIVLRNKNENNKPENNTCFISCYLAGNLGDDLLVSNFINNSSFSKYIILNLDWPHESSINNSKKAINSTLKASKDVAFSEYTIENMPFSSAEGSFLVFIGGSIWPEKVLRARLVQIKRMKKMGFKIFSIGNNLSNYKEGESLRILKNIFNEFEYYTLRDSFSKELINQKNFYFDPIYAMEEIERPTNIGDYATLTFALPDMVFNYKLDEKSFFEKIVISVSKENNLKLISFQDGRDIPKLRKLKEEIHKKNKNCKIEIIEYKGDVFRIIDYFANSKTNYCVRFHSIVLSNYFGKNTVSFSYDNKNLNHMKDLNKKLYSNYRLNENELVSVKNNSKSQFDYFKK